MDSQPEWVEVPPLGVRIRHAGLDSRAVVDLPDGGTETMELCLAPDRDLLWVVLPEVREQLADELVSDLETVIDYGRLPTYRSWYMGFRVTRYLLTDALRALPERAADARRACAALRQLLELDAALGHSYDEPIRSGFHDGMPADVWALLRAFDQPLTAALNRLAPGSPSRRSSRLDPPYRQLAPDEAWHRDWLEIELRRPGRRVVRTRYGGLVSTLTFGVGPVDTTMAPLREVGLGPYEDALWVALPEFRPELLRFVRRELSEAMAADRGLRALPQHAVCRELFTVILAPVLGRPADDPLGDDLATRCLDLVRDLLSIAAETGGPRRTALRDEITVQLVRDPFRAVIAARDPAHLTQLERSLA